MHFHPYLMMMSSDSIGPNRIILDESLIDGPLAIEECADTVVMFDDIDVLTNKKGRGIL